MADAPPIATISKSKREEIRVTISRFRDRDFIDVRIYALDDDEAFPTRKGVNLPVGRISELIKGLQEAENEARRRGLLDDDNGHLANSGDSDRGG